MRSGWWACRSELRFESRTFSTPGKRHDVDAGRVGLVGEGGVDRRAEAKAVAGAEQVAFRAFRDAQLSAQHPDELGDVNVGGGWQGHDAAGGHLDGHQLDRMIRPEK